MAPERVYRVRWENGIPFIQAGEVVPTGKKGTRCRFRGDRKLYDRKIGHPTMKAAIEADIEACAAEFGSDRFWWCKWRKNKPWKAEPWTLVNCLAELNRLYKRLKKHHLA
jgi:hypothetical protein